jgi:hypothetical protein
MVVVAEDAPAEAARLSAQGSPVEPRFLSAQEARAAARIDGAVLLDPAGKCYAIGVVLDGQASPSRGARFNSALRYVLDQGVRRLAVVRSDDGGVDVLPRLRPPVRRSAVHEAVAVLRADEAGQTRSALREAATLVLLYRDALDEATSAEAIGLALQHEDIDILEVFEEGGTQPQFDYHEADFEDEA